MVVVVNLVAPEGADKEAGSFHATALVVASMIPRATSSVGEPDVVGVHSTQAPQVRLINRRAEWPRNAATALSRNTLRILSS